jgi:hypothetical protein
VLLQLLLLVLAVQQLAGLMLVPKVMMVLKGLAQQSDGVEGPGATK